jgi:D-serine deaminase-like pyridoxal phosphate-dependent protein
MNEGVASDPQLEHSFPEKSVPTPCFVIFEESIRRNLRRTIEACGDVPGLMPHVKTHRAAWIVRLLLSEGVEAFKYATLAEVEMVLAAGAKNVTWAYPSANPPSVER